MELNDLAECSLLIDLLQVVKESMRVFFVSPLIARETAAQVEIGGYILPKVILLPIWIMLKHL